MINFQKIVISIVLTLIPLYSTIYENAEDKMVSKWKIIHSDSNATIRNVYDKEKVSRIIDLRGEGTKSSFQFTVESNKEERAYWLSWEMKFSEDFVIIVVVKTEIGKRYLIYTPGINRSYMQYGLGMNAQDGKWHHYSRNLQKDLDYFDNRGRIVTVESFIVRGSGSIDNIEIKGEKKLKKDDLMKDTPTYHTENSLPKIMIEGENPLYLDIREAYIEQGVTAIDKEDGILDVDIVENIDLTRDGEYMVMYMAMDSAGNTAVDRRIVIVGEGKKELKVPIDKEQEELKNSQKNEIEAWEKALKEKEEAFKKRTHRGI